MMSKENDVDVSEFHALTEVEELHKVIGSLQTKLRKATTKNITLTTAAREGAREAFTALGLPKTVPTPLAYKPGIGDPEVAVLHLSDWQTGKKTVSFDSNVAESRIKQLG